MDKAYKTGGVTTCSFDCSGPLTEAALLGNAFRVGQELEWDPKKLRAANWQESGQVYPAPLSQRLEDLSSSETFLERKEHDAFELAVDAAPFPPTGAP